MKSSRHVLHSVFATFLFATVGNAQVAPPTVSGKTISVTVLGRAQGVADTCRVTAMLEVAADSLADINRQLEGQKAQFLDAAKAAGVGEKAITVEGPVFAPGQRGGIFGNVGMFLQPPIGGAGGDKPDYRGTLSVKMDIPFNVGDMEGSLDRVQKVLEALKKAAKLPLTVSFVARDMQSLRDKAVEDGFAKAQTIAQKLAVATGRQLGKVEGIVSADIKEMMGQAMGGMFGGGIMGQMLGLTGGGEGSSNPHSVVVEQTLTFSFQIGD